MSKPATERGSLIVLCGPAGVGKSTISRRLAQEVRSGAGEHRRTGSGSKRGLAAASAERAGDIAALALLQQHDQQEEQAGKHVQGGGHVIKHNG